MLFRSRDWLSANQGPVLPNSVVLSWLNGTLKIRNRPKQPTKTRYLGHVTGYQPIRDQYFLIRFLLKIYTWSMSVWACASAQVRIRGLMVSHCLSHRPGLLLIIGLSWLNGTLKIRNRPKQPTKTRYLGHVTGYQPIRDQLVPAENIYLEYVRLGVCVSPGQD
eukprot:sb/3472660/